MREGADQEGGEGGEGPGERVSGGGVDVAAEEVVDGDVPFAGELQPVAGIPPVGVELAVCEACSTGEKEGLGLFWFKICCVGWKVFGLEVWRV